MKVMLLLLFVFIPCLIKGIVITPITIGSGELKDLNTTTDDETYFYMSVNREKIGPLFFFLSDSKYALSPIKGFLSKIHPNDTVIENAKNRFFSVKHYQKKETNTSIDYYYNFTIGSDNYDVEKFLIIQYSGKNSAGTLKARSSFDDLYSLTTSKLTFLHIILIAAGGIIFIGILITVLVCVCKKKKKNDNDERISITQQPLVRDTTTSTASANLIN